MTSRIPNAGASASSLLWRGTLEIPPCGVNHSYKIIRLPSGASTLAKTAAASSWSDAQYLALRRQHCPMLAHKQWVTVALHFRQSSNRFDVDSPIKLVLDTLARRLGEDDPARPIIQKRRRGQLVLVRPPRWNDRYVALLLAHKVIDRANPGVDVAIYSYAPAQAHAVLALGEERRQ